MRCQKLNQFPTVAEKKQTVRFEKAELREDTEKKFPKAEIRTFVPRRSRNRPGELWKASESENSGMPESSRPESEELYVFDVFSNCLCYLDMM